MTNDEAELAALEWAGQAGGKLLPQLTANELAGIVNEAIKRATGCIDSGRSMTNDQRMVDVKFLKRCYIIMALAKKTDEDADAFVKLRAIIDGPGVEPVAEVYDDGTDEGGLRWVTVADNAAPFPEFGAKLYLAAPSAPAQAVPDGWQLVRNEPTEYQLYEGAAHTNCSGQDGIEMAARVYRAMLAATPQPPKQIVPPTQTTEEK